MRVLLDTHSFLWWLTEPRRLSARAHEAISDPNTTVLVSSVVAWEIAIKTALGKLHLPDGAERYVPERIERNGFQELPVSVAHALRVVSLPPHHRDPFDRLLVAQALMEDVPLVSGDPLITRYAATVYW